MPKPRVKINTTALCTACGKVYSKKQWKSYKLCCGRNPIVYESRDEKFAGEAILEYLRTL